jgi:hypothetical protein
MEPTEWLCPLWPSQAVFGGGAALVQPCVDIVGQDTADQMAAAIDEGNSDNLMRLWSAQNWPLLVPDPNQGQAAMVRHINGLHGSEPYLVLGVHVGAARQEIEFAKNMLLAHIVKNEITPDVMSAVGVVCTAAATLLEPDVCQRLTAAYLGQRIERLGPIEPATTLATGLLFDHLRGHVAGTVPTHQVIYGTLQVQTCLWALIAEEMRKLIPRILCALTHRDPFVFFLVAVLESYQ